MPGCELSWAISDPQPPLKLQHQLATDRFPSEQVGQVGPSLQQVERRDSRSCRSGASLAYLGESGLTSSHHPYFSRVSHYKPSSY